MVKLSEILKDLSEVLTLREGCKTVADIYNLYKQNKLAIEINTIEYPYGYYEEPKFDEIEVLRIEHYGVLDYIYFYNFGTDKEKIYFDVWDEETDTPIMDSATLNTLEEQYSEYLKWYSKA